LPIIPVVEEVLISLRKTSTPSSRSRFAASRVRRQRPRHPERHDRVDVEHRLELLVAHLVGDAVPGVPGVVDDDVDAAEGVDQRVGRPLGGEVAGVHDGLAGNLRGRLPRHVGVEVVDQYLRALGGHEFGSRASDPACRPAHDRRFAVQKSHGQGSPYFQ
jgi:hypothetical protein